METGTDLDWIETEIEIDLRRSFLCTATVNGEKKEEEVGKCQPTVLECSRAPTGS